MQVMSPLRLNLDIDVENWSTNFNNNVRFVLMISDRRGVAFDGQGKLIHPPRGSFEWRQISRACSKLDPSRL